MILLKTITGLFIIEWRLLLRQSHEWLSSMLFFVMIIILFPLALSPDPVFLQHIVPGAIWIAALLSSLLSIETLFISDIEEGSLEQIILSPLPLSLFVFIKLSAKWIVTVFPFILLTPVFAAWFHLSLPALFMLCVSLALGTPILILLASLGAVLTIGLRQQGMLLSLLILPLTIPVLIFSISLVQQTQAGLSTAGPLAFLAALTFLSLTFLPWTIAEVLRMSIGDR